MQESRSRALPCRTEGVSIARSPGPNPLTKQPTAMGKIVKCRECGKSYRDLEELEDLRDNDSVCLVCNSTVEVADWDRILASYEDDDDDDDVDDDDWDDDDEVEESEDDEDDVSDDDFEDLDEEEEEDDDEDEDADEED